MTLTSFFNDFSGDTFELQPLVAMSMVSNPATDHAPLFRWSRLATSLFSKSRKLYLEGKIVFSLTVLGQAISEATRPYDQSISSEQKDEYERFYRFLEPALLNARNENNF